jgi:hypothetical protein
MPSPISRNAMLARGISEIDLNKALEEVATQVETGMRYTSEDMLSIRREQDTASGSQLPGGIITPPFRALPNAPPPTPATPRGSGTLDGNNTPKINGVKFSGSDTPNRDDTPKVNGVKANGVVDNALQQLPNGVQPKKKKRKAAGGNDLKGGVRGSGFEGMYFCGL